MPGGLIGANWNGNEVRHFLRERARELSDQWNKNQEIITLMLSDQQAFLV